MFCNQVVNFFTAFSNSIKKKRWTIKEDLALLNFCKKKKKKIFWRDIVERKWISECIERTPEALKTRYNKYLINLEAGEIRMLKKACLELGENSKVFYKVKVVASNGRIKKERHVGSIRQHINCHQISPFMKTENGIQNKSCLNSDSESLMLYLESKMERSGADDDNGSLIMLSAQYDIPLEEIKKIYFNVSCCFSDLLHVLRDNNESLTWTATNDSDLKTAIPSLKLLTSLANEKGLERVLKRRKFLEFYEAMVKSETTIQEKKEEEYS